MARSPDQQFYLSCYPSSFAYCIIQLLCMPTTLGADCRCARPQVRDEGFYSNLKVEGKAKNSRHAWSVCLACGSCQEKGHLHTHRRWWAELSGSSSWSRMCEGYEYEKETFFFGPILLCATHSSNFGVVVRGWGMGGEDGTLTQPASNSLDTDWESYKSNQSKLSTWWLRW